MKPTPLTDAMREMVYTPEVFQREDEEDDRAFYAADRFVNHLDDTALEHVRQVIDSLIVEKKPDILDLMASCDSHLPAELETGRVVGLGLNENELARNERLSEQVLHDLNADPKLPFADQSFDVVLNTVSVDYLIKPFEVFEEVARVLRPGGMHLVVFSNRYFPPKAVRMWRQSSDQERIIIVEDYMQASDLYIESRNFVVQGRPRPADDKYAAEGVPSDPIYAVWSERQGRDADLPERVPPELDPPPLAEDELARRQAVVAETRLCPHCERRFTRWQAPQSHFTDFDVEHLWVCFNDACPYLIRGWNALFQQGNLGYSHRLTFDPGKGVFGAIPVPSLKAMRDGIVEE